MLKISRCVAIGVCDRMTMGLPLSVLDTILCSVSESYLFKV